jgi:hypothetical protein
LIMLLTRICSCFQALVALLLRRKAILSEESLQAVHSNFVNCFT